MQVWAIFVFRVQKYVKCGPWDCPCYLQSHTLKAFRNAMYTLTIYNHTLWKHFEMPCIHLLFTITHFESISKCHVYTCYLQSHTLKSFRNAMYTLLTFDWSQNCLFNQVLKVCNNDTATTSVITAPIQCQLALISKEREWALTSGIFVNDFELTQKFKVVSIWLRLTK